MINLVKRVAINGSLFQQEMLARFQFVELIRQLSVNAVDWRMFHIFSDLLGEGEMNFDWLKRETASKGNWLSLINS